MLKGRGYFEVASLLLHDQNNRFYLLTSQGIFGILPLGCTSNCKCLIAIMLLLHNLEIQNSKATVGLSITNGKPKYKKCGFEFLSICKGKIC